jgi:hypothetical protein
MAVGFKDATDAEGLRQFEKAFVFICSIDENRLTSRTTSNDEDVVVVRADNKFMDLNIFV